MWKRLTQRLLAALALCLYTAPALADWGVNLPVGVTPLSKEIYGLHMLVFGVCCAIAVVVFGAMIYSIVSFRKSKGAQPAHFHHSTKAEILWTVIPDRHSRRHGHPRSEDARQDRRHARA